MCKRNTSIIMAGLTLGGLLLIGSPASAQYNPYNIDQRQDYQQQRIQQGIDSGALTPGEARHLEGEQARIQATEDRMRADGHLSPWERERLNQMENRASRDIDRLKHNDRTAEGWGDHNYQGWGGHYNSGWNGHNPGGWGGSAYDPRFDHREDRQQYRIQQGIHSGALTPGEARYLEREQGRIQSAEDRMSADGRLSPWERQRLNQMQNGASRDIYRLDHNGRTAGYGGNPAGWQGNNQGWGGRGNWQGNSYGSYGTTPSGTPVTGTTAGGTATTGNTHGSWGNHSGGSGYSPGGTPAGSTTTGGTTPIGTTTGATTTPGNTQGWRGSHTGWNGSSSNGTTTSGTTTPGTSSGTTTAGNTQGWQGNHSGWNGSSPSATATGGTTPSGTTAAGNTQGWRGNYGRNGQAGAYQQPNFQRGNPGQNANWQGQPRFQQPRPQMAQNVMRPNTNMMARQPGGLGGIVNRAANTVSRAAPRRR